MFYIDYFIERTCLPAGRDDADLPVPFRRVFMIKDDFISGDPLDLRYRRSIIKDEKVDFYSFETSVI